MQGRSLSPTSSANIKSRYDAVYPVNTKHLYKICTMLDLRRRRWEGRCTNTIQMFCACSVVCSAKPKSSICFFCKISRYCSLALQYYHTQKNTRRFNHGKTSQKVTQQESIIVFNVRWEGLYDMHIHCQNNNNGHINIIHLLSDQSVKIVEQKIFITHTQTD